MSVIYNRSLSIDFSGNLNPVQFRNEIEADPGITPTCYIVLNIADDVDIEFSGALSGGEETILNGLISSHVPLTDIFIPNIISIVPANKYYNTTEFTRVDTIIYEGSNNTGNIFKILVVAHIETGATDYTIKIFDQTQQLVLAENTFTNTIEDVVELTPISNIPVDRSILELSIKKSGGVSTDRVHIDSAMLYLS